MILKIIRYVDQDWWILDDIRKISKARFEQSFDKDFNSEEADIFILDFEEHLKVVGGGQNSREIIRLVCKLSDGGEFYVLFDTMAYLLNDNGKTIEKLVANYR